MTDRILLIEDDARLAAMVSDYLSQAGFRIERAGTGAAGLAQQARDLFDAIMSSHSGPASCPPASRSKATTRSRGWQKASTALLPASRS